LVKDQKRNKDYNFLKKNKSQQTELVGIFNILVSILRFQTKKAKHFLIWLVVAGTGFILALRPEWTIRGWLYNQNLLAMPFWFYAQNSKCWHLNFDT
jgi:hypothetical protein